MIWEAIVIIIGLVLSVILHELGHVMAYYHYTNKNPKLKLTHKEIVIQFQDRPKGEYVIILICGIVTGSLPIIYVIDYLNVPTVAAIGFIAMYLGGCYFDFQQILKVVYK